MTSEFNPTLFTTISFCYLYTMVPSQHLSQEMFYVCVSFFVCVVDLFLSSLLEYNLGPDFPFPTFGLPMPSTVPGLL